MITEYLILVLPNFGSPFVKASNQLFNEFGFLHNLRVVYCRVEVSIVTRVHFFFCSQSLDISSPCANTVFRLSEILLRFFRLVCALQTTGFLQGFLRFLQRALYSLADMREYVMWLFSHMSSGRIAPGRTLSFLRFNFLFFGEIL